MLAMLLDGGRAGTAGTAQAVPEDPRLSDGLAKPFARDASGQRVRAAFSLE